jgi:hypothetical protein
MEKGGADPIFQGADAPAESRLRHGSGCSRFRKIQGFSESQKIFQPGKFHW